MQEHSSARKQVWVVIVLLVSVFVPYGLPAAAGSTDEKALEHCNVGPDMPMQCFATEAEALYEGTGGRIKLEAGQSSKDLTDDELFGPNPNGASVYSTLYENADYGGATLSIYASSCSGWNNISGAWNDRVSSARTNTCGITLYEHYNLTGPSLRINYPGTNWVGVSMNDKASSWSLP